MGSAPATSVADDTLVLDLRLRANSFRASIASRVRRYQTGRIGNILRDDLVQMKSSASRRLYPAWLRRVVAMVEVDSQWRQMVFLSDNLEWSAQTIADLYRCRWDIEVFFKEIKQTLQLADFLGHNAHAVRWQVWTALLTYVLLRFCAWMSRWGQLHAPLYSVTLGIVVETGPAQLSGILWDSRR